MWVTASWTSLEALDMMAKTLPKFAHGLVYALVRMRLDTMQLRPHSQSFFLVECRVPSLGSLNWSSRQGIWYALETQSFSSRCPTGKFTAQIGFFKRRRETGIKSWMKSAEENVWFLFFCGPGADTPRHSLGCLDS